MFELSAEAFSEYRCWFGTKRKKVKSLSFFENSYLLARKKKNYHKDDYIYRRQTFNSVNHPCRKKARTKQEQGLHGQNSNPSKKKNISQFWMTLKQFATDILFNIFYNNKK